MAVAKHFSHTQHIIVPNVWWGIGLQYEADMVILRDTGYAVEVEIKTNAADILADLKKRHQHDSRLFCELWFAVPEDLSGHPAIPQRAGILAVVPAKKGWACKVVRKPQRYKQALKWSDKKRLKLLHLGCLRIWGLKEALLRKRR